MGRKGGKGGKRSGGKGGGGGGGGKGGKGKGGKGQAEKRRLRRADREEEEHMRSVTSAAPAKGGKKGGRRKREREEEEEPVPVKQRPSKPGFGSLLTALGVVDSDPGESDEDEEVEEEGGEEESDDGAAEAAADASDGEAAAGAGEGGEGGEADGGEAEGEEGEDVDIDAPDEAESDEDDEDDEEGAAQLLAASNGKSSRKRGVRGDAKQTDMLDFYSSFWQDPPGPLLGAEASGTSTASTDRATPQHFALPSLQRCEAQRRDVTALRRVLPSAAEAAAAWKRCGLAPELRERFEAFVQEQGIEFGPQEGSLFLFLHAYLDVSFPVHSHLNAKAVRALGALHVVDHVLKSCKEVLENSAALNAAKRRRSRGEDGEKAGDLAGDDAPAVADQGFTRPRCLIVCPFRSVCHEIVQTIMKLFPGGKEVGNAKRFEQEFGEEEDEGELDANKPADWRHLFQGNTDDRFRLGISFSRKKMKLYSPFVKSDILICSPLGLRTITGAAGDKKREFDFLSSIEVCIIDRADVLAMQNLEHLQEVIKVVNHRPQNLKDIDISRLRPAFADGHARLFRQTLVTSCGQSMDAEALFAVGPADSVQPATNKLLQKWRSNSSFAKRGKTGRFSLGELEDEDDELPATLAAASTDLSAAECCRGFVRLTDLPAGEPLQRCTALGVAKQFFLHVPCGSVADRNEQLFSAFCSRYWKPLGSSLERLIIVANSYFNFLQLRRFFRDEGASFASAFEYAGNRDLSSARFKFFHGQRRVILTTERFLWYRRYKLKGGDYVLFFGPPETASIYEDVLNGVRTPSQCNSMCLFTQHDAFALERVAGHERARRMLTSAPGKVFVYS